MYAYNSIHFFLMFFLLVFQCTCFVLNSNWTLDEIIDKNSIDNYHKELKKFYIIKDAIEINYQLNQYWRNKLGKYTYLCSSCQYDKEYIEIENHIKECEQNFWILKMLSEIQKKKIIKAIVFKDE